MWSVMVNKIVFLSFGNSVSEDIRHYVPHIIYPVYAYNIFIQFTLDIKNN